MNRCGLSQLDVYDTKVYPRYFQPKLNKEVGSKKRFVA